MNESIASLLREPLAALRFRTTEAVVAARPGKYVLATDEGYFLPQRHAQAGKAELEADAIGPADWGHRLNDEPPGWSRGLRSGWMRVTWQGNRYEVLELGWVDPFGHARAERWLVADDQAAAAAYFVEVTDWCADVHDEVLVYANGCFSHSPELFESIQKASWDEVVLEGDLLSRLRADFDRFVAARADYDRWRIPWKRGALFIGPPGNGKTLTIRALVKHLGLPCLYVQSFTAPRVPEESCIREVFERARRLAPCVIVLEDLDALVRPESRSFFLNELDGFADNTGLITIGSTNHPDELDPAILDRPSRFDRKYHFALPGEAERARYLARWAQTVVPELRPSAAALARIAAASDGFSFAYLKELFAASLSRVVLERVDAAGLEAVLDDEVVQLKKQMGTALPSVRPTYVEEDSDPYAPGRR